MNTLTQISGEGETAMKEPGKTISALGGAFLLSVATLVPEVAGAGEVPVSKVNTGYFGNVAIEGYDTVAYFKEGRAVKGSAEYSYEWFGAEWHFSKAEHRALFQDNPLAYSPQYGGLCADGVSYGGMTANIDPEAFSIIDGKLYLNADMGAKEELDNDPSRIENAEANWPAVEKRFTGN
jgi:YHS domain-containing protein